jgi:hypothetical protein
MLVLLGFAPNVTSMAQRTASTTLRNSTRAPSPVRFMTRPLCTEIVGSMRSLRSARRRARVQILVRAGEPGESDNVSGQDRGEFANFCHQAPFTSPG